MLIYLSTNNHKREPNVSSGTYWLPSFFSFFLAYFVIHNIVHPWPRIECPKDMTIDLSPGKRTIEVNIPQPATNVDYTSHVEAEPSWAKKLRAELGPIRMVISFRARNPVTEYTAICSFVLEVRGTRLHRPFEIVCVCVFVILFLYFMAPTQIEKPLRWRTALTMSTSASVRWNRTPTHRGLSRFSATILPWRTSSNPKYVLLCFSFSFLLLRYKHFDLYVYVQLFHMHYRSIIFQGKRENMKGNSWIQFVYVFFLLIQEPNSLFALGEHVVTYTASDAAGNSARCQFTVNVLRRSLLFFKLL